MIAPDFSLQDQDGKTHTLGQYRGKWVLIYFYPKDDTPGCTKEACGFRDLNAAFQKKGVVILGISKDSVKSHAKFTEKFHLNFPILSDESIETIKAYKSWGLKKFMGREYDGTLRNSYLVNPNGEIVKTFTKVNTLAHPNEVLQFVSTQ
ncbi:MAG TPA: thioredoxin-dependent thiol peroxidase [Candidatus Saccharimonadia bacterium]|nr:thioredoxin-dependent thiol peroxidase [Candidatus Saccharimonadia bacterium]